MFGINTKIKNVKLKKNYKINEILVDKVNFALIYNNYVIEFF